MSEPRTLETVLADWREREQTLRACKRRDDAELLDLVLGEVTAAAEPFTRWLFEDDARMRSGNAVAWFRRRFPEWQAQGHARVGESGRREYRLCVVPQRAHLSAAREAGRQAARRLAGGGR